MNTPSNLLFFGLLIPLVLIWVRAPFAFLVIDWATWGGLVLTSYFIHRLWFARLLAKDGFRLVTFAYNSGFIIWDGFPAWWEYCVPYTGTAAARSGDVARCSLTMSGAMFALIRPQISYFVEMPREDEIWLNVTIPGNFRDTDQRFDQLRTRLENDGVARYGFQSVSLDKCVTTYVLEPGADSAKALLIMTDELKVLNCLHEATVTAIGFEQRDGKLTRFEKVLWPLSEGGAVASPSC